MAGKINSPITETLKVIKDQYIEILKSYKDFSSRTGRKKYWFFTLINIIISVILSFFWTPLALIFQLLIFVPSLAVTVRRFHDIGKNPWYILVPGYNVALLLNKEIPDETFDENAPVAREVNIKDEIFFILSFSLLTLSILRFIYAQEQAKKNPTPKQPFYISEADISKEEDLADVEKANEQSLQEVREAETLEEIIQAYQNARQGSQASIEGALKWVAFCRTSQEIKEASKNFSENSEAWTAALEKWKNLSQREYAQASTIEALRNVYENAPDDDNIKKMIYTKWNELSLQKADELQNTIEAKEAYDNSPISSESRDKILNKWKELTSQETEQVQDFEEIKNLYNNAPDDETLREEIFKKWVSLCQTSYQAKELYSYSTNKSNQKLVLDKWEKIANQEIEEAQNLQDINYLYGNLPDDETIKSVAILKQISLCQDYLEIKDVYLNIPSIFNEEREIAFNKWDSLAIEEIKQAQTLEAVREIYNNTPENSSSRQKALEKIRELS